MEPKIDERLRSILPDQCISADAHETGTSLTDNPVVDVGIPPSRIVRPQNADELKNVVELSNKERLNLTLTSSTGRHTKGGIAAQHESILIDLSSWKGLEWTDRRNRVCMIQPGVTYGELSEALGRHGMVVPMPLSPRNGKSVIASVTDREPSSWPNRQWDFGDPVASTEVIFGNGSPFRTGAAGGPGTLEMQRKAGGAQKYSGGPSQTDLHRVVQGSQGTIGVITWITIRTEIKPTINKPFLLGAESLDALIPFIYEIGRPGLGEEIFVLNRRALTMLIGKANGGSPRDPSGALPPYVCLVNIAGFERLARERVRYQEHDIRKISDRCGLSLAHAVGPVSAEELLDTATKPCGEIDWRHKAAGHCLSVFFLSTLDRTPALTEVFIKTAIRHKLDPKNVGVYVQPIVQHHACHVEFMFPFDPERKKDSDRVRSFEEEVVIKLAGDGAFFSRPYGAAQGVVFQQNPIHHRLLKQVKEIFDPHRVLNRGKWDL